MNKTIHYVSIIALFFICLQVSGAISVQGMEQVIHGGKGDNTPLNNVDTTYNTIIDSHVWTTTQTYVHRVIPTDGVIKYLRVKLVDGAPGAGNSYAFTLMLNGAPTALTLTITGTDTFGKDMDHEIDIEPWDLISLRCVPTSTPTIRDAVWSTVFAGEIAKESIILGGGGTLETSNIEWGPVSGGYSLFTDNEGRSRSKCPTDGYMKKLYVHMNTDPGNAPDEYVFSFQLDGDPTALAVTIVADDTTGSDLADSINVPKGEDMSMKIDPNYSPLEGQRTFWGMVFLADVDGEAIVLGGGSNTLRDDGIWHNVLAGVSTSWWIAPESDYYSLGQSSTIKNFYIQTWTTPYGSGTDAYYISIRENGVNQITVKLDSTYSDSGEDTATLANDCYLNLRITSTDTPFAVACFWGFVEIYSYIEDNEDPTITSASISDRDDTDNIYEMESYYSFVAVVNDQNGATDIDIIWLQGCQGTTVRFEVRATSLTGSPSWAIQTGGAIIDLDTGSCTFGEAGDVGTATFKIRAEWDFTDEADLELRVYVEDSQAASAGLTTMQTNYFDVLGRLVTSNFATTDNRINKNAAASFSGNVYYATTIAGNTASTKYPPDGQFTSVDLHDSGHVERGMDDVIINGAFSDSFNIPDAVQLNTYHSYLDMDPDYTDADAPDGDTVAVIGDCIKILTLAANNTTPAKNEPVLLYATAELEFDNHVVGSGDSLSLEALAFTWNGTSSQWEKVVVSGDAETRTYNEYTSGNEATYTITVGNINGQTVSITWGQAPTITSASISDMDDTDNVYAMRKYYTWIAVVNDVEGATDIDMVYLQITNGGVVGEFRATDLTGTPAWSIQTGATVFDLDGGSCIWYENGDEGTATFMIRVEWDITQCEDMNIEIHVEDSGGGYANFTEMQTDYVDLISRLVTKDFTSNTTSSKVDSPIQVSGSVRYATTIDGNLASDLYPPSDQFTSIKIRNDQEEIEALDTTISNGNFNVTFNSHYLIRATYYYVWLDLLDDYIDGLAPDGDYVSVITSSGFYLSWLIDQSFNFFGIGGYITTITAYGTALGTYFSSSVSNLLLLIVQQFRVVLGIFGFFVDWYTRMVSLFIQIGGFITGVIDGTGDINTGLGNVWDFIAIGQWIDIIPVLFFIWWVESVATRGETQGEISVFLGDMQTVMNVTSWFMSMFSLVVNTMTDLAFRLMEAIT